MILALGDWKRRNRAMLDRMFEVHEPGCTVITYAVRDKTNVENHPDDPRGVTLPARLFPHDPLAVIVGAARRYCSGQRLALPEALLDTSSRYLPVDALAVAGRRAWHNGGSS
jgi:hypothetical protein